MKKLGRRALSVLVAVILVVLSNFICLAEKTAQIEIATYRYNSDQGTYVPSSSFGAGETIVLGISFSGIADCAVRGNNLSVTFNTDCLEFSDKNSICCISDKNAVFLCNAQDDKAIVVWDTTSVNTYFNGTVYYLKFKVAQEITKTKTVSFGLEVQDFYESANGFNDIPFNLVNTNVDVVIITEEIDEATIKLFNKLEKVDENSLSDITAAMEAYNALSNQAKKYLSQAYPQQYEWLSTAYDRYHAAVQKATEEEIKKIVSDFLAKYEKILSRDLSKVTLNDVRTVESMQNAYKAMPSTVTSRLSKEVKQKIEALAEKIVALRDAQSEVKDFREAYSQYYELEDSMYITIYDSYYLYIDEALMMYDSLSEEAKAQLQAEYERLKHIDAIIDELLAKDEAETILREKVSEFQQRWLRVFGLTTTNVSLADKSAIEMVIADYEKLDDDVKDRLKSRIANLNNLLTVIKSLETENEGNDEGDSSAEQQPEKIIQTVTQTVTEKVPEVVTETVTKKVQKTTFTKAIWILLALLVFSFLLLVFPIILQARYKHLLKELADDDYPIIEEKEALE